MAYDEMLALRVRQAIEEQPDLVEKKMFGGVGFMLRGNMACGVNGDELIVRVGPDNYETALAQPHANVFDMTGRPMTGWVRVSPEGIATDESLSAWVGKGVDFALTLPPK
jgi:hypothetical protein